jgi:hypothetical protein
MNYRYASVKMVYPSQNNDDREPFDWTKTRWTLDGTNNTIPDDAKPLEGLNLLGGIGWRLHSSHNLYYGNVARGVTYTLIQEYE